MRVESAEIFVGEEVLPQSEGASEASSALFAGTLAALVQRHERADADAEDGELLAATDGEAQTNADEWPDAVVELTRATYGARTGGETEGLAPAATDAAPAPADRQANATLQRSIREGADPSAVTTAATATGRGAELGTVESTAPQQNEVAGRNAGLEAPSPRDVTPTPAKLERADVTPREAAAAPVQATADTAATTLAPASAIAPNGAPPPAPARAEASRRAIDAYAELGQARDARAAATSQPVEEAQAASEQLERHASPAPTAAAASGGAAAAASFEIEPGAAPLTRGVAAPVDVAPASTAPAVQSTLPPQPVQAVPHQIQLMAQQGGGTARIQLSPPELGDLQIRVSLRGSAVDVVIRAEEPAAQLAVMSHREQLAESLGARDLRMDGFDVRGGDREAAERGLADQRAGHERSGEAPNDSARTLGAPDYAARGGAEPAPAPAITHTPPGPGGVDLRI